MEKVIVKASNKTTGKEKYDLYIGRWQPWHDGHQWLINQSLQKGKNVCIAIRDVEVDEKNPWTAYQIFQSLVTRFQEEKIGDRIALVIIPDIDSINIGRDVGYDIIEHIPSDEIAQISATKIREELKSVNNLNHNKMKYLVPKDKENYLEKNYPFENLPKLTDKRKCLHCGENFVVGDFKVLLEANEEYIVCPNAPTCKGDVMDWVTADKDPNDVKASI